MKSNKRSKNVKKRKIDCKRQKRQKENLWIGMGTVTMGPWKQLLLSALDSNSHLKHSSYFQLVPSFFPHLFFFSFFLSLKTSSVIVVFVVVVVVFRLRLDQMGDLPTALWFSEDFKRTLTRSKSTLIPELTRFLLFSLFTHFNSF